MILSMNSYYFQLFSIDYFFCHSWKHIILTAQNLIHAGFISTKKNVFPIWFSRENFWKDIKSIFVFHFYCTKCTTFMHCFVVLFSVLTHRKPCIDLDFVQEKQNYKSREIKINTPCFSVNVVTRLHFCCPRTTLF